MRPAIALVLLLGGCARGTQSDPPDGLSSDTRDEHGVGDLAPETTPDLPRVLDHDGDGHCAPGTDDPDGLCVSLLDCDDSDKSRYPGALENCANAGVDNDWTQSVPKVSTTRLRLYGAHATTAGYAQNPMIFEWRVSCQ